jgi:hypothetical protein
MAGEPGRAPGIIEIVCEGNFMSENEPTLVVAIPTKDAVRPKENRLPLGVLIWRTKKKCLYRVPCFNNGTKIHFSLFLFTVTAILRRPR